MSGATTRRGGVGSPPVGAFVVDADLVRRWIVESAARIGEQRDFLTQLDAAIGDADHGVNMVRGFDAALATLQSAPEQPPGALLQEAGTTLIYRVGGAAGPLFGTGFRQIGATLSEAERPDGEALLSSLRAGLEGIQALGAAAPGDKTMVDAWEPAVAEFERTLGSGGTAQQAARERLGGGERRRGGDAADAGSEGASVVPRLTEHRAPRPGATSTALIFGALELAMRRP